MKQRTIVFYKDYFEKFFIRIFCFFDQGQIVVIANGFQKKSQKTSKKEIEIALKIKKEYDNGKNKYNNTRSV